MKFLVLYAPTILFILFFIGSLITGFIRGRRKAAILAIHALVAFGITVLLYIFTVKNKAADTNIVNIVNLFMGENGLQEKLGVSVENKSLTDILIEYIPKQMNYGDGLYLVFAENGGYLYALVSQVYHLIFAILFILVYVAFVFIFYLIYLIFYPDRRYFRKLRRKVLKTTKTIEGRLVLRKNKKRKLNPKPDMVKREERENEDETVELSNTNEDLDYALVEEEKVDGQEADLEISEGEEIVTIDDNKKPEEEVPTATTFFKKLKKVRVTKKRVWGMAIQGVRSLITSLFIFALIGSLLYIMGGTGKRRYDNNVLSGTEYEVAYDAYQTLGSYGTQGIYAVLNSITDKDDFPYYLYLVDLIYRTDIEDQDLGKVSFNMSKEMTAYSNFTRSTIDLAFKYKGEEIRKVVTGQVTYKMPDVMMDLFKDEGFRAEFDVLIDEFEGGTYFINMGLSFVTSFVNHMDETKLEETIGNDGYEALAILFKKGYLSDYIPNEAVKKRAKELNPSLEYEDEAYITPRSLLSKEDTKRLVNVILDYFTQEKDPDNTIQILKYSKMVINEVKELSILSTDRKEEMNPVLKRLYTYLENRYLEEALVELTPKEKINFKNIDSFIADVDLDEVDWIKEIDSLLDVAQASIDLYMNVYKPNEESIIKMIAEAFDTTSVNREANILALTNIRNNLASSKLLDKVLSSNGMYKTICNALANSIYSDIYVLDNIKYSNTYDTNGNIVSYGELYKLITGITTILTNPNEKELLNKLESMQELEPTDVINLLGEITTILEDDIDTILDSDLLNSAISGVILANKTIDSSIGLVLYVPDDILQTVNGKKVNLIDKNEISFVFETIDSLIDTVSKFMDQDNTNYNDYDYLISNIDISSLNESTILKGTIANVLISNLTLDGISDYIILPDSFKEVSYWVDGGNEITKLLNAISNTSLSINVLTKTYETKEEQTDAIINMLNEFSEEQIDIILESDILYLSISHMLTGSLTNGSLLVPTEVKVDTDYLINNNRISAIKRSEIKSLFNAVIKLDIDFSSMDNLDVSSLINKLNVEDSSNKTNLDYAYESLILEATITDTLTNIDSIIVPNSIRTIDKYTIDNVSYYAINKSELKALVDAAIALGIDFNALNDGLKIKLDASSIDTVSNSLIIRATLTDKLINNTLDGTIIIPDKVLDNNIINETEFKNLLTELVNNQTKFFTVDDNDMISLDDISFDENSLDISLLKELVSNSIVFKATIIDKLDDISDITIPYNYSVEISTIKTNYDNNIFVTSNEVDNMLNAMELIFGSNASLESISNSTPTSIINNISIDDVDSIYNSIIFKATLSNKLSNLESSDIVVPYDSYSGSYYINQTDTNMFIQATEIKALINVLNDESLSIDLDNPNFDSLNLTKGDNGNIVKISKSKILRASINSKLNSSDALVIPYEALDGKLIDNSLSNTNKYVSEEALVSLLSVILDNKYQLGLAKNNNTDTPITLDDISIDSTGDRITAYVLLDLIHSNILHATIINNLYVNRDTFDITIPTNYAQKAEKNELISNFSGNIWVTTNEASKLLNGLGEIIGFDVKVSSINSDINNIAKPLNDTSVSNPNRTKILVACDSKVLKATLSYKVYNLDTLKVPYDSLDGQFTYSTLNGDKNCNYIDIDDLVDLINVLNDKTLNLDLNNVNLSSLHIETGVNPNTESNVEVISTSKILRSTIYNHLVNSNDDLLIPNSVLSGSYESLNDNGYICYQEMVRLLSNIANYRVELGTSSTSTGAINVSSIDVNVLNLSVDSLQGMLSSDIMHATAISKMDQIEGILLPYDLSLEIATVKTNYLGTTWYTNSEIEKLITAIKQIGITKVKDAGNIVPKNAIDNLSAQKINILYESSIMVLTLSDKIINLKKANNTSLLHIPSDAVESVILIDQYNYANTITKFEMKAFVKGIQGLELDISNDNFANSITINSQKITLISVSYIISATASDVLIANNDIYIPESAFDSSNNMIKREELYKFLTAINTGMGITSTAINASQITPNAILDADSLVDSIIMRATITALCSSDEANIYVDTDNIEVLLRKSKTIIDNNQTVYINVLSSNEIKALLDIIGNSTSFELDITLSEILALSDSDIEIYMSSIIFRIKVSKLLIDNGYKNMLVAQSSISITVGGSVETYNLVLTSTPNVYKFISPTNVICYDIMSVGQTTTSVEILTVRDILAYKTYISSIM